MAGYIGTKAVLLSTTAANVTGEATIGGDLNVDTGTLFVDSTNNRVGIGTGEPAEALDVVGLTKSSSGFVFGAASSYLYEPSADTNILRVGSDGPYVEFVDAGSGVLKMGNAGGQLALTSNGTESMRLDDYGRVTKPYQPIWGGRHSGGNLNDFVTMYNDAYVTNGSGWVLSGGSDERLYPPVSGWYQITMTGLANTSVGTQGHTQAYLYKSGVSQYNACAGTTDYTRMIIHAYLYLTPTDWISFYTAGTAMHTDQAYNKVTCMLVA